MSSIKSEYFKLYKKNLQLFNTYEAEKNIDNNEVIEVLKNMNNDFVKNIK